MKHALTIFISILIVAGCKKGSEYYEMEARELARDVRFDSIFFGIYLGMPADEFYQHCWELNKTGLFRQGASNTTVLYQISDFSHPASMNFYPRFYEDKIIEMPVIFTYDAWSPWNQNLNSDHLKQEVLNLMKMWFGDNFLEIRNPKQPDSTAYVKIEGNRRVSVYNLDESKVQVDIVDLRLLKSLEKNLEK